MTLMHKRLLGAACMLCCLSVVAQADTRLSYAGTDGPYTVSIRPDAIRIDRADGRWQLYLDKDATLFTVLPEQRSYTRMDADAAVAMRSRMAAVRAKIEAQLAQLPAAKRRAARAALAEQLPSFAAQPQPVSLHDNGKTTSVAGIECRLIDLRRGDQNAGRVCVAPASALGLSSAGQATLTAMFRLMQSMLAGSAYAGLGLPYLKLQGVPIRVRSADGSRRRRLQRVSHASLPAELFTLPASFSATKPPGADAAQP